ncbi:MAG TPA: DUF6702 family protein [Thermoanaerobaculia bacterium]|nr:DUF6702 family protein [Thermoanaerobaculia bacterium]
MRRAFALFLFAPLGLAAPGQAHPFHASRAEIDYRAECRCLEVALAVVPEELEAALQRISGKRVPLESPEAEAEIVGYLKTRFVASPPGGEPLPIKWVGREVSYREAWLYFKVTGVGGDFDLVDRVLFEAEPSQVNHVLLRGIGEPRTLSFRAGEGAVRISTK